MISKFCMVWNNGHPHEEGVAKHIFAIEEALKDHNMPQEVLVWRLPKGGHTLPPRNNITLLVLLN